MALSSRIRVLMTILMNLVLLMNYLLLILLNKMASWSAKTELLLRWLALCLMNTKPLIVSGLMQLILHATSSTEYIFTNSSRRLPMNSSMTRNPIEHLPSVIDEPAPEESIKFKATEDVIPTEESAEEFIPEREERRANAAE